MSDQEQDQAATIEALKRRIQELEEKNAELENELQAAGSLYDEAMRRVVELEDVPPSGAAPGANVEPITGRRYVRGKLPGDKLIRIDTLTNTHEEVTREEWDAIPAGAAIR